MKKRIGYLCAVLLAGCISVPVLAAETELTVSVPEQHTVTIESDGGRIAADGTVCGDTVEVERHKEQAYRILPDAGKVLESLTYNGEDVTEQVKNGIFTAPALVRDAVLRAVYTDAPAAPDNSIAVKSDADITTEPPDPGLQTGDDSALLIWSMILLMSSAILFLLPSAKKQRKSE